MESTALEPSDTLDGLTLTDFRRIIERINKHSPFFKEREHTVVYKSTTYDDSYRQNWSLIKYPDKISMNFVISDETAIWIIGITYLSVHFTSVDFDYEETVSVGRTTAYKKYRGTPHKVKFAPSRGVFRHNAPAPPHWWSEVFSRLTEKCDDLDALQGNLALWVKSGLDMEVRCLDCFRDAARLTSARLAGYSERGWSLSDLRDKLICKSCGHRNSQLLPT